MNVRITFAAALAVMAGCASAASDPLDGLQFADGKSHAMADYKGQVVVVVNFCAH